MRIGICYDRIEEYAHIEGPADRFAEFEPESTILAMENAIQRCGHEAVRLGGPLSLLAARPEVDLIWNIAEGYGSRNREGWVPSLCEMYGIRFLGSDAFTLTQSLDKAATKELARGLGIPTSDWIVAAFGVDSDVKGLEMETVKSLSWPIFVKPRYEGTAKGISESSILRDMHQLEVEVARLHELYKQDVIIERFLPGSEYTVALTGNPLEPHPVMERGVDTGTGIGFHVMDGLGRAEGYRLEHNLRQELEAQLQSWSVMLCNSMRVRDYARLDFKCDAQGNPFFLEINPLPTFATDNTFAILAELEGVQYDDFLSDVLKKAIERVMGG